MRKYHPISAFIGITQLQKLKMIAAESQRSSNPAQQVWSVSKLIRAAVRDFLEGIEEWDDARRYAQSSHKEWEQQPQPTLVNVARMAELNEAV